MPNNLTRRCITKLQHVLTLKEGQFVGRQVEPVLNFGAGWIELELCTLLSGEMLEGLLAVPSATTVAWPE